MTEGDDRIMDSFNGVTLGRDIPFDRKKKASGGLMDAPGWEKEPNRCYELNEIVKQDEKEEEERRRNGGASVGLLSLEVIRGRLDGEILPEDGREREAALRTTLGLKNMEIADLRIELDAVKRENKALKARIGPLEARNKLFKEIFARIDSVAEERGIDLMDIINTAESISDENDVTNSVTKIESDENVTVTKIVTKVESDESVTKVESDESVTKVESDENDVTNSVTKVECYESVTNSVTKGRPRLGEQVMTAAERMRKMRAKAKAEKGETP